MNQENCKIPFSYYSAEESKDSSTDLKKLKKEPENTPTNKNNPSNLENTIEAIVKTQNNFLIPAICLEVQKEGDYKIELKKDDLTKFFSGLGEIKHIEITNNGAYVLYSHYFSALLAKSILSEIITKEGKTQITVKLVTKDEEDNKNLATDSPRKNANKKIAEIFQPKQIDRGLGARKDYLKKLDSDHTKKVEKKVTNVAKDDYSLTEKINDIINEKKNSNYSFIPKNCPNPYTGITCQNLFTIPNAFQNYPLNSSPIICPGSLFFPNSPMNFQNTSQHNFQTFSSRYYSLKFVCNFDVQIENLDEFKITRRLIGYKGACLKKILFDSCIFYGDHTTKVRLRGKGSGYKEGDDYTGKFKN